MGSYLATADQIIAELNQDNVVGLPTETVYGLAARIDRPLALEKIFKTKQRPFFDPLIVHVHSVTQAQACVKEWTKEAQALADSFWPGPITIVLEKSVQINNLITSGLDSVGLRCPAHKDALHILKSVGVPLAAPSANRFGKTSPTTAAHVLSEFPDENLAVFDGGSCEVGIESTVVLLKKNSTQSQFSILRPGFISAEQISKAFANHHLQVEQVTSIDKKESPGHMKHHYMPAKPLIICKRQNISDAEILQIFNEQLPLIPDQVEGVKIIKPTSDSLKIIHLELPQDGRLAARSLYSELRAKAQQTGDLLFFTIPNNVSNDPLWNAVIERLAKAATIFIST